MKRFLTTALRWCLKKIAQGTIWKFRPGIVGVTGSVGKTSTKLAIAAVLKTNRTVRVAPGNLNSDFGLPLTIIGEWTDKELALVSRGTPAGARSVKKILFWLKVLGRGSWRILFARRGDYPEFLVLEYGADKPGDIRYLLSIARPNISVITTIGDIPVHVEFYAGPQELAREKAKLIEYLPSSGYAILNHDDETVMNLKSRTRAAVMTFGYTKGAHVQVSGFEARVENGKPAGIMFRVEYGGSAVPVRIESAYGKVQSYAAAAAAAVGLILGMNLVRISQALKEYHPAPGRMRLLSGIKSSLLLDDSYNASPLSMHAALDTLKSLPAVRRIAVLGDMLEIGAYAMDAHTKAGERAAESADVLVTIGARAKFIAEGAKAAGMNRKNIYSFDTQEEAQELLGNLIKKGDAVLVKASHAIGLEELVKELEEVEVHAGPVV